MKRKQPLYKKYAEPTIVGIGTFTAAMAMAASAAFGAVIVML